MFLVMPGFSDITKVDLTLPRDPALDHILQEELGTKRELSSFNTMMEFRKKLPSFSMKDVCIPQAEIHIEDRRMREGINECMNE